MPVLDDVLAARMNTLEQAALRRRVVVTDREEAPYVMRGGKRLISFSCNDYLGLSKHPKLVEAACAATQQYGVGGGASRLVTGNHPLYEALESALAAYKGTEAACVFGSGYLANIGTITALMNKGDLILADKLSHSCIVDAAQLSGATFKRFAHNDLGHLDILLQTYRQSYERCLIVTETVFSMDGDIAPLEGIMALAKKHSAWVMSDDAHGLGLVTSSPVDIQMGTLSKAAGVYGGYVCGSQTLVDYLKNSARSLIYTTSLPPGVIASSVTALEVMQAEPERGEKALANVQLFTQRLGFPSAQSAIVPLVLGDAARALEASRQLEKEGFLVSAIRPPTVPANTARLRFAFSALHESAEIERLTEVIRRDGWLQNTDTERLDAAS